MSKYTTLVPVAYVSGTSVLNVNAGLIIDLNAAQAAALAGMVSYYAEEPGFMNARNGAPLVTVTVGTESGTITPNIAEVVDEPVVTEPPIPSHSINMAGHGVATHATVVIPSGGAVTIDELGVDETLIRVPPPVDGELLNVRIVGDVPRRIVWGDALTGTLLTAVVAGRTHTQRLRFEAGRWVGYLTETRGRFK